MTPGKTKRPWDMVLERPNNKALKLFPRGPRIARGTVWTALSIIVMLVAVVTSTPALPVVFALRLPKPAETDVSSDSGLYWSSEGFVSERASVSRLISRFPIKVDHLCQI